MSCRVIGYGVETALLAAVSDDAQVAGATQLVGEYIESPRNAPAGDFYQRHGFAEMESTDGAMRWRLALTEQPTPCPPWIRMQSSNDA
jgi:predicted enzyme involved in methoxymalonyl-ACP biosynthesis